MTEKCDGEGKEKKCYNVTAFSGTYAYVMSPSKTVSELVAKDLISKGVIDEFVHYPYPGQVLKLAGDDWDDKADTLSFLMRMAFPSKASEMQAYMDDAKNNNKLFRVTVPSDQIDDF